MSKKKRARAKAPAAEQPDAIDEHADVRRENAEMRRQLRLLQDAEKAEARGKLSELEQITADTADAAKLLAAADAELTGLYRGKRLTAFAERIAEKAPDVPASRLRALLLDIEADGFDIAPEHVTPARVGQALAKLKEIDPASFQAKPGASIPGPGATRTPDPGPTDWRQRGAQVAGRRAFSKTPADDGGGDGDPGDEDDPLAENARLREQLAALSKEQKARERAAAKEGMSPAARARRELEDLQADLDAKNKEILAFRKEEHLGAFLSQLQCQAPGVPQRRLRALLRVAASEHGLELPTDITPEAVSEALAVLDKVDPSSFAHLKTDWRLRGQLAGGKAPPPPRQEGPMDWRERGRKARGKR